MTDDRATLDAVVAVLPLEIVRRDASLAGIGRWQIGGPVDLLIEPRTSDELAQTLSALRGAGVPWLVIGDGSNLLFDDAGLRGAAIRIGRHFRSFTDHGDGVVEAGAGLWVPCYVRRLIAAGLSGAVHAIGIPGTLGGLVTMNGGSQRRGIGEQLIEAVAMNENGHIARFDHAAMRFAYRASALQESRWINLSARFAYPQGDARAMHAEARKILRDRRLKFPRNRANCGSVFVSDPALYDKIGPPGAAIERAGLKGRRIGGAQLSPEHANFIVNCGGATSADVLRLIGEARRAVEALSGIAMLAEVRHVRPDGTMAPAHVSADALNLASIIDQEGR